MVLDDEKEQVNDEDGAAQSGDATVGDDAEATTQGDDQEDGDAALELSQDEIDSLLGVGDGDGGESKTGVEALVNSSLVAYERLPMLDVVFDRLVRLMSTSLRNFTSDNVEVSVDKVETIRFGEYLNAIPLPAMLSVIRAHEWDNYGIMTVDSALIYSIVDVLLGGRRGTAAMRIEGRPYTTIERGLVERMIHVVLDDLSSAFDPLSPVSFRFERLETNPRFAAITRAQNACILVTLRVDMEVRGGRLDILLPNATLEPIREILLQMFMGEKFGRDSIWENHLVRELWNTSVELEAVLGKSTQHLDTVLNWKVGSQLILDTTPESSIDILCGQARIFRGKMGKKKSNVAIRLEKNFLKNGAQA